MAGRDPMLPELLMSGYPAEIRDLAERLRGLVRDAVPEAIERVWRGASPTDPGG